MGRVFTDDAFAVEVALEGKLKEKAQLLATRYRGGLSLPWRAGEDLAITLPTEQSWYASILRIHGALAGTPPHDAEEFEKYLQRYANPVRNAPGIFAQRSYKPWLKPRIRGGEWVDVSVIDTAGMYLGPLSRDMHAFLALPKFEEAALALVVTHGWPLGGEVWNLYQPRHDKAAMQREHGKHLGTVVRR